MAAGSHGSISVAPIPERSAGGFRESSGRTVIRDPESVASIGTSAWQDGHRPCLPTCCAEAFIRFLQLGQITVIVSAMRVSASDGTRDELRLEDVILHGQRRHPARTADGSRRNPRPRRRLPGMTII